eukprot:CAMPEP_0195291378 /NCGR_PEP_ID=MMETSP0707-20130614/7760_1 /TAXON_ID=33640 /ORGANISM="Asterionellopsis glacialis, Strain CCMP134" /LENGTH=465 /DNA_ID=CAMNT_0040351687 /DNA_START=87 /DNA_END=1484 /DNA_ORIENTATION=-
MKLQVSNLLVVLGISLPLGESHINPMNSRDIPFPRYRFTKWALSDELFLKDVAAPAAGYSEGTWDTPSVANSPESKSFNRLASTVRQSAKKMGFSEEVWDCYVNHYTGKTWKELNKMDLAKYFKVLGLEEPGNLDNKVGTPSSATFQKKWGDLDRQERSAAEELCYTKGSWEGMSLADWGYPIYRLIPYSQVARDKEKHSNAKALGYHKSKDWDNTRSNPIELNSFEVLTSGQKLAAKNLGFTEDGWDCYQNHYAGYTWDELATEGVQTHYRKLDWNHDSWHGNIDPPKTEHTRFEDLTTDQQSALSELCYTPLSWNEDMPIPDWPCFKTHYFDSTWPELQGLGVQEFFVTLGWSHNSWHGNIDAPVTHNMQWKNLTAEEKYAAGQICFDETDWSKRSAPKLSSWKNPNSSEGMHPFWIFTLVLLIAVGFTAMIYFVLLKKAKAKQNKSKNIDVEFVENPDTEMA